MKPSHHPTTDVQLRLCEEVDYTDSMHSFLQGAIVEPQISEGASGG